VACCLMIKHLSSVYLTSKHLMTTRSGESGRNSDFVQSGASSDFAENDENFMNQQLLNVQYRESLIHRYQIR
jgi:hypothetical protein